MNETTDGSAFSRSYEAQRLHKQAQGLRIFTQRLLETVGFQPGMKVLDVGSGAGDTAFLLAEKVGPTGTVIGVDKKPDLVAAAQERAQAAKLDNVTFIKGDLLTLELDHDFDAIYGRLVLIHVQDQVTLLRRLARHVRSGGIIAFQETDFTMPFAALPEAPLFQ
jgi:ubiquinone/menaquinone biosynthesis C-methylase UbiE